MTRITHDIVKPSGLNTTLLIVACVLSVCAIFVAAMTLSGGKRIVGRGLSVTDIFDSDRLRIDAKPDGDLIVLVRGKAGAGIRVTVPQELLHLHEGEYVLSVGPDGVLRLVGEGPGD